MVDELRDIWGKLTDMQKKILLDAAKKIKEQESQKKRQKVAKG